MIQKILRGRRAFWRPGSLLVLFLAACTSCQIALPTLKPTILPASSTLTASPQPAATLPATHTPTLLPSPTFTPTPTPRPNQIAFLPWELVQALAWMSDGEGLAVAAGENVYLYDFATLQERFRLPVGVWSTSLAFDPAASQLLAMAARDGSVQIWDAAAGQLVCRFVAHLRGANSVAYSLDGRWLATTGNDAIVKIWDAAALRNVTNPQDCQPPLGFQLIGGAFGVPQIVFSPDGQVVASVDQGTVRLRYVESQRLIRTLRAETSVFSIAFDPLGQILAAGEISATVRLWDVPTGAEMGLLTTTGGPKSFLWSVAFSPDGRFLAAGSSGGAVTLWDAATRQVVRQYPGHARAVTCVRFSPDGRWLLSGGLDAVVKLWSVGD
jgi:WD40 repeat protein